jgi:hypothetical protein
MALANHVLPNNLVVFPLMITSLSLKNGLKMKHQG